MSQNNRLFGNRMCWKITNFFTENPGKEFSQIEIIKKLKIAKLSAIKWLKFLEKKKIILKKQIGRTNLYRLNRENPVAKQIKIVITISNLQTKLGKTNAEIYLFGSAARGEDDEKSDIDILVIGTDRSVINKIKKLDRKIKITFFTPLKWSKMATQDPAFYERVEKDKIRLVE